MVAWNKGKRVGQKKAFKLEDIWRILIRLELEERLFELALFNLAIDSKLRTCDLRNLKMQDVSRSGSLRMRCHLLTACFLVHVERVSPSHITTTRLW